MMEGIEGRRIQRFGCRVDKGLRLPRTQFSNPKIGSTAAQSVHKRSNFKCNNAEGTRAQLTGIARRRSRAGTNGTNGCIGLLPNLRRHTVGAAEVGIDGGQVLRAANKE
jgi:hypothetical protein